MAEAKVIIGADITKLEKAITQATEKLREFSKGVGEIGNDMTKGLSGFDISKALGIGGAIYAAGKLGDALVDAVKEGYKEFQEYQEAVLKFKYNLPSSMGSLEERGRVGAEIAENSSKKAGVFTEESLNAAQLALIQASKEFRESPEKLNEMLDKIQALAIKTGSAPEAIAEAWRKLNVSIKEEGGAAVGKFFKATPGMEEEVESRRDADAADYLKSQGLKDASQGTQTQQGEYNRRSSLSGADFMSQEAGKLGTSGVLKEIQEMMGKAAPTSIIKEAEDIDPLKMLAAAAKELQQAFGSELKPAIDDAIKTLGSAMPQLKDNFKMLADVLNLTVVPAFKFLTYVTSGVNDVFATVGKWFGQKQTEVLGTDAAREVSANLKRMGLNQDGSLPAGMQPRSGQNVYGPQASTGPNGEELTPTKIEAAGTFEREKVADYNREHPGDAKKSLDAKIKAETDISKMAIKSDADHATAQRQIDMESAQSALTSHSKIAGLNTAIQVRGVSMQRSAAQVAQDALMAQGRIGALTMVGGGQSKDVMYQEQTVQIETANKVADISAETALKQRALSEDAAERVGKIETEEKLRAVDRAAEDEKAGANMTADQKAQRDKVRQNEDIVAENAKGDILAVANQKIRNANLESAEKIIEVQLEAANKRAEIEYDAAVKSAQVAYDATIKEINSRVGPAHDNGPQGPETYSKFGKGGQVIEGSYNRRIREEANKKLDDDFKAKNDADREAALQKKKDAEDLAKAKEQKELLANQKQAAAQMQDVQNKNADAAYAASPTGQATIKAGGQLPSAKDLNPGAAGAKDPNAGVIEWLKTLTDWVAKISGADDKLVSIFSST